MRKRRTIVIAALLRDVEARIPSIIRKAERVGQLFADYRILIVENDSSDNTRSLLRKWANRNSKVIILGCGVNATECKMNLDKTQGHAVYGSRIEKMVKLRNIYLDFIKENLSNFDYVAIWDLDIIGTVYLDGIINSLGFIEGSSNISLPTGNNPTIGEIAAMCANGVYDWGLFRVFYDTYAFLDKNSSFHIDNKAQHDVRTGIWDARYDRGDEPVQVESCFSGFTLYVTKFLTDPNVFYDMSPDSSLECEHVRLHKKIRGRIFLNPSMIYLVVKND